MQEQHLYEYAVIRWVPQVERDEFINIGIMLYCKSAKTLNMVYHVDKSRLASFNPLFDLEEVKSHLTALENICKALPSGGPIAQLDVASRFRWLTAMRSTTIQTSRVHPGLCFNPLDTLDKLFRQLVLLP